MRKFKLLFVLSILIATSCVFARAAPAMPHSDDEAYAEEYTYITIYPNGYAPPMNPKQVYLTFDDGPTKHTSKILEILEEHDVLATFFVVGNREHNHYMADIVEAGHAIGLHSYDHAFNKIYSSEAAFFDDLQKIDDIVFEQTGVRSKITRFPGGSSVKRGAARSIMPQLKEGLWARGYQFFDWNCDSRDKMDAKTASLAFAKIETATKEADDIVIVLMHDTEKITVEYLPWVIKHFKTLGYDFLPLCTQSPAVHHNW